MSETYRVLVADDSRIRAERLFTEQFEKSIRSFLEREVRVEMVGPFAFDYKEVKAALSGEVVMCTVVTVDLSAAKTIFLMKRDDAALLADLLNMGDGSARFIAEEHLEPIRDLCREVTGVYYSEVAKAGGPHLVTEDARAVVIDTSPQDFIGSWSVTELTVMLDQPITIVKITSNELIDVLFPQLPAAKKQAVQTEGSDAFDPALKREMGLVMDIELPISIELGRTHMLIRDIVKLSPGSVVELDKLSGEPVDLFVNSKRFARGEVVVIEENFAVRITELINPEERLNASKN